MFFFFFFYILDQSLLRQNERANVDAQLEMAKQDNLTNVTVDGDVPRQPEPKDVAQYEEQYESREEAKQHSDEVDEIAGKYNESNYLQHITICINKVIITTKSHMNHFLIVCVF